MTDLKQSLRFVLCLPLLVLTACGDEEKPAGAVAKSAGEATATGGGRPEIFVRGSAFRGVNGILFGPDGNLWLTSVVTPLLAAMDPDSGEIVERYSTAEGVKGPDDLAFGPDGSVYWTDITFGEVARRTPDGTTSVVANLGPGVNPITFSGDGRLFVSQCFLGDKLYEVDPDGGEEPRLISDQLGPGCGLNGMDWGPDGRLYGPRWFHREVVRVDVESGRFETAAAGFQVPSAVKFDGEGRLHVLDTLAGEILRVDLASGGREVVGRVTPRSADNIAFSEDGRLFVSSFSDGSIAEILDPDTVQVVSPGGLSIVGGLGLHHRDGTTTLYVADFFALRGFDPDSGEERYAAREVLGVGELGSVTTVEPAGEHLLLTSWLDNEVRLWDPVNDERVAGFPGFQAPTHAVAFQGDIVVSESGSGSVLRFHAERPEDRVVLAAELQVPAGLATDGSSLWVSVFGSGLVLQLVDGGQPLETPIRLAEGLEGPEGMTVVDGGLLVVEAGAGRLTRIDLATRRAATVAEGLDLQIDPQPGFPPTMLFNDVVAWEGRAIVSGDRRNVLYRIPLRR